MMNSLLLALYLVLLIKFLDCKVRELAHLHQFAIERFTAESPPAVPRFPVAHNTPLNPPVCPSQKTEKPQNFFISCQKAYFPPLVFMGTMSHYTQK